MRPYILVILVFIFSCSSHLSPIGKVFRKRTIDNKYISVEFFKSKKKKRHYPVAVCHGFTGNREYFKIGGKRGLLGFFLDKGFDVYLVELRGRERYLSFHSVDDYIFRDLPAIISIIYSHSHRKFHWIGHSMGGFIMYPYLAYFHDERILSLITIGSGCFFPPISKMGLYLMKGEDSYKLASFFPLSAVAKLLGILKVNPNPRLMEGIINRENVSEERFFATVYYGSNNVSGNEYHQLLESMKLGYLVSFDGKKNYCLDLHKIRVPTFLIAGRLDRVMPPWSIIKTYRSIGSRYKDYFIAGKCYGSKADYGHIDLIVGDYSYIDIFPKIVSWIERVENKYGDDNS